MKALRTLGLILIVLVALLATAAIALLLLVDPNQFKGELTRSVKDSKQRTLSIEGDLKLTLFPRLGVDLGKTTLSERNSSKLFASVASARVSVALLPLLKKQLRIDHVRISGVNASLTRSEDGKTNMDDLIQPDSASAPETGATASKTVQFDVAGFELIDSTLKLDDAMTQTVATLDHLNIRTGRIAEDIPTRLEIETGLSGRFGTAQSTVSLHLGASAGVKFKLQAKEYRFSDVEVKLAGSVVNTRDLGLSLHAASLAVSPSEISTDNLKLRAQGKRLTDPFEVRLDIPKLNLASATASSAGLSGELKFGANQNGGRELTLKFDTTVLSGTSDAFTFDKLKLLLNTRQGSQVVEAKIDSSLKGQLESRLFELPAMSADIAVSGPVNTTMHFNGSLRLDLNRETMESNLDGRIDGSKLDARLSLTGFSQPAIDFDIGIDQINLNRYMGNGATIPNPNSPAPTQKARMGNVPEKPLDLSALESIKAQGQLRIHSLQVQNLRARSVALGLQAINGQIEIAPFAAELYQGNMNGSASITASRHPQFALRQNLTGVAIQPLIKDALNRDVLEGYGDVRLDIHSAGNTLSQLKSGLNGSTSLRMRDGAVKGFNLAKSLREFKSRLDTLQGKATDQTQAINTGEKTDFSELAVSFNIRDGVAASDDLNMKSPFLRVGGAGRFDLAREQIDYVARATVVNTSSGQDGKDLAQLTDLTIPVRLSGPFNQPRYSIEWSGVASKAVENKLKSKLTEKLLGKPAENTSGDSGPTKSPQDQLKEKLQDRLKGLLNR